MNLEFIILSITTKFLKISAKIYEQIIYPVNRKYGCADTLQKSQKLLPLQPSISQDPQSTG